MFRRQSSPRSRPPRSRWDSITSSRDRWCAAPTTRGSTSDKKERAADHLSRGALIVGLLLKSSCDLPLFLVELLDLMVARLQVSVLHCAVEVDRIAIRFLELVHVERAVVHGFNHLLAGIGGDRYPPRQQVAHGIHRAVCHQPDSVANRRRTKERQHHVRTGRDAVVTNGEAEVVVMLLEPEQFAGRIEKARESDRRVDAETGDFRAGLRELELKQIVGEARNDADVVKESADALANGLRRDDGISAGYRPQHPIVELEVEGEHRLVEP